jgi:glycosyltransferase involved in cell wall biosynthesis
MPRLVLVTARLTAAKGIDDTIRAIANLPARLDHTVLAIAGTAPDPAYETTLRNLADRLLPHRTHFLGHRTDIPDLLRAADVLVLASEAEGLPLCVLEAQASGTPTVAYPAGGVAELIRHDDTGLLVNQGDVDDLTRQLTRILTDHTLAGHVAATALDHVQRHHTMDSQANAHAAVLEALRPGRRGHGRRGPLITGIPGSQGGDGKYL